MHDAGHRAIVASAATAQGWSGPAVQKAHKRSETFGLTTSKRPDYDVISIAELALKREQNRVLCAHAMPVMETLHEQIVNTQSMIVLTDAEGLILHSIGDDDFLLRADKVALRAGANWAEDRQGTNAIGTSLAEGCAMAVHGDQHFLAANRFLTCSSVPILDPYGDLIGVLDVTGDHRSYHQHTMALSKMSVQMIENHVFTTTFRDSLQVSFHGRPEFLGTLMEGIIAFSGEGTFLSANRSAQFQLGMTLDELRTHTLLSLFETSGMHLIDRVRASVAPHVMLNLHNGTVVCARVQFRHAVLGDRGGVVDVSGTVRKETGSAATTRGVSPSQLAALDTGDPQVAVVVAKIRKVMGKDIPILITGETGTGKELLAQAIHADSPRGDKPFVAVNCASIPEALIESELFGYEEGAFTGARRKGAVGKLLQANGGTLFLDEIGDMPYPLQVRLLRVLQERRVNPLGSTKSIPVDLAIICATHRNIREMIVENRFRDDLYYRLNGLLVRLPALRDRTDLTVVVQSLLRRESHPHGPAPALRVAPEVMALFARCTWPGNFRQLHNILRTAVAMRDDDGEIRVEHLPEDFFDDLCDATPHVSLREPLALDNATARTDSARLTDMTTSAVIATLARYDGNVSATARALGVSRNTVYRKMNSDPLAKK
jgi:transcriptional regulator of acetoin/glycerol metabolism